MAIERQVDSVEDDEAGKAEDVTVPALKMAARSELRVERRAQISSL